MRNWLPSICGWHVKEQRRATPMSPDVVAVSVISERLQACAGWSAEDDGIPLLYDFGTSVDPAGAENASAGRAAEFHFAALGPSSSLRLHRAGAGEQGDRYLPPRTYILPPIRSHFGSRWTVVLPRPFVALVGWPCQPPQACATGASARAAKHARRASSHAGSTFALQAPLAFPSAAAVRRLNQPP